MDDFKEGQKQVLKDSITTIVENYKILLISNNNISGEEKQRFYNDLEHNVTLIEFITKCKLDKGILWEGMENRKND